MRTYYLAFQAIIFLFLSNISAQDSQENSWQWQYPKPQANTLKKVVTIDENNAIAIGEFATIIKTTDGGNNWNVNHHFLGLETLSDIFFLDKSRGWISGNNCLLTTVDGGENWSPLFKNSNLSLGLLSFINDSLGWATGRNTDQVGNFFKTIDGGKSWTPLYAFSSFQIRGHGGIDFINENIGYLVGDSFNGNSIFKTTDGGNSWGQFLGISPNLYLLHDLSFISSDTGWIVGNFGDILKTTDGGNSWQHLMNDQDYGFHTVYFQNEKIGWVGGDNITERKGVILKTTDGGTNWEESKIDSILERFYSIDFYNETAFAVGESGIIYKTTDNGLNWQPTREDNYHFRSIHFADENNGWAVGDKGIILHTENGGKDWNRQNQNDSLILSSVFALDDQNVFAVGTILRDQTYSDKAVLLKSINGGLDWIIEKKITNSIWYNNIYFFNNLIGWITGANGILLKTSDKGITWDSISVNYKKSLDKIQFINNEEGWISPYRGNTIFKTSDGGINWHENKIDSNCYIYSFHFVDENIGFAAGAYSGKENIYKTTDGGETWKECNNYPISDYRSIKFINENVGWAVGDFRQNHLLQADIIKTTDGGNSWVEQEIASSENLTDIFFLNSNAGWAVGQGIFKTTTGGGLVSIEEIGEKVNIISHEIYLSQNYPNPFNPSTIIKYKVKSREYVSLKVFDLLGREVSVLVNEQKEQGNYEINFKASDLASGIYFYRINIGKYSETKKNDFIEVKKMKTKTLYLNVIGMLKIFALLVTLSYPSVYTQTLEENSWQWQYPKPQANTLKKVVTIDENNAIAIGEFATIIKTTDGGNNWNVKHHFLGLETLSDIFFLDKSRGWISGNNCLLTTVDGGENWSPLFKNSNLSLGLLSFINDSLGWATGRNTDQVGNFFKTIDGGKSWTPLYAFSSFQIRGHGGIDFINENIGYLVGDSFNGNSIFKTTDGGNSWGQFLGISPNLYLLHDLSFISSDTGWIVGNFGDILKTTDGGNSWQHLMNDQDYGFHTVYFQNEKIGWVGGDNITERKGVILKTTDGGTNWEESKINSILERFYSIDFYNETGFAVGESGIIYKTIDNGLNWQPTREDNYHFRSIHFADENNGWAVGDKGIILHTENGGEDWNRQNQNDSLILFSVFALDNDNVFAVGSIKQNNISDFFNEGIILNSTNSGMTWNSKIFNSLNRFHTIIFTENLIGWLTGDKGTLLKSIDKGKSWDSIVLNDSWILDKIQFINKDFGWISIIENDSLLYTSDGGENWTQQLIHDDVSVYSFNFLNSNKGWAVGSYKYMKHFVFKTDNGGKNWYKCDSNLIGYDHVIQFVNEKEGWISSYSPNDQIIRVIKSIDGGFNWQEQKVPLSNYGSNLFFIDDKKGWVVGEGILKTDNGGGLVSIEEIGEKVNIISHEIYLSQNFPNPFNPSTIIKYKVNKRNHVLLKVYDILGREISVLINEQKEPGNYKIEFNALDLASGIYLYRINIGKYSETKKMILLR